MSRRILKWVLPAAACLVVSGQFLAAEDSGADPQTRSGGWRRFGDSAPPPNPAPAPNPPASTGPVPAQLVLPAGTWVAVRVNEPISSDHNHAGDAFSATLIQPLIADGYVVARRGQTVGGRVAEADKGGRVKGTSRLGIELTDLTLVDGQPMPIRTQLTEYSAGTSVGRDATAIGATTGLGAAIGAAANGGVGAGVGAAAGAVAATIGVLTTRGHATVVYPEATLTFRLLEPVTISTERSAQAFQPTRQEDYGQGPALQHRPAARYAPPPPYYGYGYYDPFWGPYPYYYGPGFYGYFGPRIIIGGRFGGHHR
jgi:hypothetical protein